MQVVPVGVVQVAPPGEAVTTRLSQLGPVLGLLQSTLASRGTPDAASALVGAQGRLVTVARPMC